MTVKRKKAAAFLLALLCLLLCGGCKSSVDAPIDSSAGSALSAPFSAVPESSETSSAPVYYVGGPADLENMAVLVEKEGLILPDERFISKEELQFDAEGVAVLPDGTTIIDYYHIPHGSGLSPESESQRGENVGKRKGPLQNGPFLLRAFRRCWYHALLGLIVHTTSFGRDIY